MVSRTTVSQIMVVSGVGCIKAKLVRIPRIHYAKESMTLRIHSFQACHHDFVLELAFSTACGD